MINAHRMAQRSQLEWERRKLGKAAISALRSCSKPQPGSEDFTIHWEFVSFLEGLHREHLRRFGAPGEPPASPEPPAPPPFLEAPEDFEAPEAPAQFHVHINNVLPDVSGFLAAIQQQIGIIQQQNNAVLHQNAILQQQNTKLQQQNAVIQGQNAEMIAEYRAIRRMVIHTPVCN